MAYAVLALTGVGLPACSAGAHRRRWRCRRRTQRLNARKPRRADVAVLRLLAYSELVRSAT